MRLQARKQAKKLQKPGRPSVLQTLANSASKARARQESVQLEYENWYTAPHSCELQLVQKSAGTQRARNITGQRDLLSLRLRTAVSDSTAAVKAVAVAHDAEAGSDPTAPARDHISTREPAVAAGGRLLVPADESVNTTSRRPRVERRAGS